MNLESICTQLNAYLVESEDLYWQNWVGLKSDIQIAALNARYPDLFSLNAIDLVRTRLNREDNPEECHRLRAILGQLTLSSMENVAADLQQDILKKEAETSVQWNSETIPIRTFQVRIMQEPDPEKRREMIRLRKDAIDAHIHPLRCRMMEKMFQVVRDMGYDNYIALCEETQDRDFRAFAEDMNRFMDTTEAVYRKYLDRFLSRTTGSGLTDKSHSADLTSVMKCGLFDRDFPPEQLLPVLHQTVESMGFSMDPVHLDLEDRPHKKPRPCVSAVNPPDDVRLTIYPLGGFEDYSGLLHEAGHAIHFVHETRDLDFIFKFWGDRGFTEGTAYLFQNITMNPVWLREIIGISDPSELLEYNAFMGILRFRRLIGQFLYQLELFASDDPAAMSDRYVYHFERAHQVKFEATDYLSFDMEFYSAGYVRARMFELQLREYLENEFGPDWWRRKSCGDFLVTLFRNGRKNRADDVVKHLGYIGLSPAIYRDRYTRNLVE